ncbi:LysR family transcriptional regulator [Paraburkholderia agricolaris]|uniref:LysR family transcriptional regulator n=1 Tax=Paraburkholderia agricolaris TaxID=2152888 RepID=UPI0038B9BD50
MSAIQKISWDDLRIFLEISRHKTLSAAARKLGIDISTVSRRVAHLETSFNETLFVRDHSGFHLTQHGAELLQYVQEMDRGALAITEFGRRDKNEVSGRVRVATMEGIATTYLAGEFSQLRKRHPKLEIELVTSANLVHVNRREADIFLSFFPADGRGLELSPIGEFCLHLYAAPAYLESRGTPTTLDALREHDFVSYIDDLIQLHTVRWLREAIERPQVVFHSSSMLSQMFAAASGMGLVMLPTFTRAERFGLVAVLREHIAVSRTLYLAVHKDLQFTNRIKAVVQFLRDIVERDLPLIGISDAVHREKRTVQTEIDVANLQFELR